jgi:PAS domain S-box-containing protein
MPSSSEKATSRHVASAPHEVDFGGLLEAVPGALVGVDRAGVIRYVNRRAQALFDYERDALVGQHIETLVPDDVRPVHPAHREAYFAGPGTRRPEPDHEATAGHKPAVSPRCLRGRHRDGTEFPLNLSLSKIDTEDGLLVVAAVHDLTHQKQVAKSVDLATAAAEQSDDAVIRIGPDGIITSWNPAAERLYGHSSQEMIGKSGLSLTPDRAPD